MAENLHFRVSSGLKNIIGRELINDKYIAIFELVKNSYDAGANRATIRFDNLGQENATITISDDGKGMNKNAIIDKWLFVAYSEKRNPSYRDNIKRAVAGAKGVGRFSCDRLGASVNLSSKISTEEIRHAIAIQWDDFERDMLDDFTEINVVYNANPQKGESSGTVIVISQLREAWNREELLNLKKALTQLVNPSATSSYDPFEIVLEVPALIEEDLEHEEEREKVNGPIVNNIFEVINQKTTRITASISEDGKTIKTSLNDRGTFLFETVEKNEYSLSNINCTLYFLNRAAKLNFTRKMGMEAVNYGSIFVYKNGFRVYPYGEPGRDFFDIDQRKGQGYKRFLGTRELIGQIEINGEKNNLVETSSRNNGFIATTDLDDLKSFFMEYVLKPLEKYVVNIVQWGDAEGLLDTQLNVDYFSNIEKIIQKIKTRSKNNTYISIDYNKELLEYIRNMTVKETPTEQLIKIAKSSQDGELIKTVDQVVRQAKDLAKRANVATQEAEKTQEKLEEVNAELATTKKQVRILNARKDLTAEDAIEAMHVIKGYADAIDSTIFEIFEIAEEDNLDVIELKPLFESISQVCKKIMNSYNLVMRTNYSATSDVSYDDLSSFISQYLLQFGQSIDVKLENPKNIEAKVRFNPLEFSIILDNLIDNSRKANASTLILRLETEDDEVVLRCFDNGSGLKREADASRLFETGYTKTSGTGIGLSTVKKYIERSGGRAIYNPNYTDGFEISLHFAKWT